jgi:NitT/TauT family transport system permease protein
VTTSAREKLGFALRRPIPRATALALAAVSLSTVIACWHLVATNVVGGGYLLPRASAITSAGLTMFRDQNFLLDLGTSGARILLAFSASALIAVPLGLLMSSFGFFSASLTPLIEFVRYVPVPALAPFFVLLTGIGELPKFLILFFGTFFQLVLIIRDDADRVPEPHIELARTLGASTFSVLKDVMLPYLMPTIYDRLRVTLGWCWTYLVIAELIAVERGVGHAIKEAQRFNASERLFVCLISLGLIGLLTDWIAQRGYSVLFPEAGKPGA